MTKSAVVYREANKEVAKIVGVKNEPTTTIESTAPTEDEIEEALDITLNGGFMLDDEPATKKPMKKQAASKKIEIKD
jgi:hypothetical protein